MAVPAANTYRRVSGNFQTGGPHANARLTTALAGANDDLTFTAKNRGLSGNSIRVRYVVAGANTPLTVSVSSNDITVNVATNGSSVATSTATQVMDAVNAHADASKLVSAALAAGSTGVGVVSALAFTNLTGGTAPIVGYSR